MDNIDVDALRAARDTGSTIMYFAGVAQRFPNVQTANAINPARQTFQRNVVGEAVDEERPPRYNPRANQQTNEVHEAQTEQAAPRTTTTVRNPGRNPVRQDPVRPDAPVTRNTVTPTDRVRVGQL